MLEIQLNTIKLILILTTLTLIFFIFYSYIHKKSIEKWTENINNCRNCGSTNKFIKRFQKSKYSKRIDDAINSELFKIDSCRPVFKCDACKKTSGAKSMYNVNLLQKCPSCNSSYLGYRISAEKIGNNNIQINAKCSCTDGMVKYRLNKKD